MRQGLRLLGGCPNALAVAMSGSGPSLFALFRDLQSAWTAQEAIREAMELAGFESWVCPIRTRGVSLES